MLKPVKLLICCLALLAFLGLYTASAQTVLTVREAEFRSRWAGPQEDREVTPQFFQPDGGLTEKDVGVDPSEQTTPTLSENMDRLADNFRRRLLRLGILHSNLDRRILVFRRSVQPLLLAHTGDPLRTRDRSLDCSHSLLIRLHPLFQSGLHRRRPRKPEEPDLHDDWVRPWLQLHTPDTEPLDQRIHWQRL
jgi:hypothetical protein